MRAVSPFSRLHSTSSAISWKERHVRDNDATVDGEVPSSFVKYAMSSKISETRRHECISKLGRVESVTRNWDDGAYSRRNVAGRCEDMCQPSGS